MKSFLLVAMLCLAAISQCSALSHHIFGYEINEKSADYIVMEDAIQMVASTDSSNGDIDEVKIYNTSGVLILTIAGCPSNTCRFNLSGLSVGNYDVDVYTTNGHMFSGSITRS